jgi:hypothetical protein
VLGSETGIKKQLEVEIINTEIKMNITGEEETNSGAMSPKEEIEKVESPVIAQEVNGTDYLGKNYELVVANVPKAELGPEGVIIPNVLFQDSTGIDEHSQEDHTSDSQSKSIINKGEEGVEIGKRIEAIKNIGGTTIRTNLIEGGYDVRLGVTNKMLEKYALEVCNQNGIEVSDTESFWLGFIFDLGEMLVSINYAKREKKEQVVYNKVTVDNYEVETLKALLLERDNRYANLEREMKSAISAVEDFKKNVVKEEVNERKRSSWLDSVDGSILFLRSSQWAFLVCLVGVFGQSFHIYHVTSNISDLNGVYKVLNSGLWAWFFSFSLMYFSLKLGVLEEDMVKKIKKVKRTIGWLVVFDMFANLYYWSYKFILMPGVLDQYSKNLVDKDGSKLTEVDWSIVNWMTFDITKVQWPQMIGAVAFSIAIPFLLKAFAGEVRLPAFLDERFRGYVNKQ